jgi:hypothetical protein
LKRYEARQRAIRKASKKIKIDKSDELMPAVKSLRVRHKENLHYRTPWGWPGAHQAGMVEPPGLSDTVRNFTDRLMREKQLVQPGQKTNSGSIRALLEDRYGPASGMREISYQKVKRPLLRDPSEQHDQLDNLGKLETSKLRRKLEFLSAMNNEVAADKAGTKKRIEFRYVELKDLKQPWGW